MKKGLVAVTCLALVILSVAAVGCTEYFGSDESTIDSSIVSQQNIGIWVTGIGNVTVVPDVAVLSLGVQVQKDTVAEAQQEATVAMDAIMAILDDYNIDEGDIQTQQYSIQPVYRWDDGEQILLGYSVTNMVTVKVRDIDDTGGIIDVAAAAGGDYIRVNSISFIVDEPEAYLEDARQEAMEDAEAKAKQLADLGDVELGKPIYIAEAGGSIPPVIYRDYAEGATPDVVETSISPGETEVQLTVQVVYSIG